VRELARFWDESLLAPEFDRRILAARCKETIYLLERRQFFLTCTTRRQEDPRRCGENQLSRTPTALPVRHRITPRVQRTPTVENRQRHVSLKTATYTSSHWPVVPAIQQRFSSRAITVLVRGEKYNIQSFSRFSDKKTRTCRYPLSRGTAFSYAAHLETP